MDAASPLTSGIRNKLRDLSPVEAKVARTLLELGDQLIFQSASEVASRAGAALSTVVRTCQTLGFKGFQDLKLSLAREGRPASATTIEEEPRPEDESAVVLAKLREAAREAVDLGVRHVEPERFDAAVSALARARRILCLGVGTSAPLAQDAAYRFLYIGYDAEAPADVHVQHVRAALLGPQDVVLVISHTGNTRETLMSAQAARSAGASIVTITSFPRSPLADLASISLVAATRDSTYRVAALSSRLAHLVVLDGLWLATALRSGDRALELARRVDDIIAEHRD